MESGTNTYTQKITYGAMVTAIFALMLLINRQTGNIMEEVFLYLFPVPMVAFSARASIPVLVSMALISFLFGTFTTIFYAVSSAFTGLVLGARIYHKRDMTRTLILVMAISAACNLLSTYVLASFMGYDLNADLTEMQTMMNTMMEQAGMGAAASLFTPDYIRRLFLVSMTFMGLVQGFLVYQISLLLLRRLRYPIVKPRPVTEFYPPRWTGFAAFLLTLFFSGTQLRPISPEILQNILQAAGMFGVIYLAVFGILGILLIQRAYLPGMKLLAPILSIAVFAVFPLALLLIGFFYISGNLHRDLEERIRSLQKP